MIVLGLIFLGYGAVRLSAGSEAGCEVSASVGPELSHPPEIHKSPRPELVVEIAGAVQKPGVYQVKDGDRVADLVEQAGGLGENVDTVEMFSGVNLAKKLSDEEKVIIPVRGYQSGFRDDNSAIIPEPSSDKSAININTASQIDLEAITGIGSKRAQSIIAGRPYDHLIDLVDKGVIGESLFEKIKTDLTVR